MEAQIVDHRELHDLSLSERLVVPIFAAKRVAVVA